MACVSPARKLGLPIYIRRRYPWREPTHPLAQQPPAAADGVPACFSCPASGALRELVADHIVQGRVVFPGAGYLEMARAPCGGSGALLRRVFFIQPLLLDSDVRSLRVVCEYVHWLGARACATVGRPCKHHYLHGAGLWGETLSSR